MALKIVRTPTKVTGGITPKEKIALDAHAQLWIKRAMRTDPIEPDKIIPAIEGLYAAAGLKKPRVVIVPSPLVMACAYGAATAIWDRRGSASTRAATYAATANATANATRDATADATAAATYAATANATRAATDDATAAATAAATANATAAATDAAADAATHAATAAATANATAAATDAATRAATASATHAATANATRAATHAATVAATAAATRNATRAATDDATANATHAATVAATYAATANATAATRAATVSATHAATDAATANATAAATDAAADAATRAATAAATADATAAATRAAIRGPELEALRACREIAGDAGVKHAADWGVAYQGGNMWAPWDAYITAMRDVLGLRLPEHEKYAHWEQAAIHGGFRVLHPEFCIVSDFPEVLKIDAENRPHCETGPSHRWRDGWSLYHWHGVRIPAEWIEDRQSLTAKAALTWENIEQRRAACEIVGWSNILKELDAKTIDKDDDPEIGELVEVTIEGNRERFLSVQCGTKRRFSLPVPSTMKTALEANAWTYGVDGDIIKRIEVRT